jgi:hypothetical protein
MQLSAELFRKINILLEIGATGFCTPGRIEMNPYIIKSTGNPEQILIIEFFQDATVFITIDFKQAG